MEISESLKRFRRERGLNQRQVADALEIPYQSYQCYEYGRNIPSASIIVKLAIAFNVSADYLLGLIDNPAPNRIDETPKKTIPEELIQSLVDSQKALALSQKSLQIALENLGISTK